MFLYLLTPSPGTEDLECDTVKRVDNPTDAKKVCGSILYMDGLVSCGCLQTRPSSASGAGISAVSVPYLQHLGQEGVETAFFNSWAARTLLEEADRSNNCPDPRKGP